MVDLDPSAMYAKGVSATDVSNALNLQNLILPAGDAKFGDKDYNIKLNSSPRLLNELNDMPVRVVNGATVYMRDVAQVRDGATVQTGIVRVNGSRGALMSVLRNGRASTIDIVNAVKAKLPIIFAGMPPELQVRQLLDQSIFVKASIMGVVREAVIAAFLTGLMILLFSRQLAQHGDRLHFHSAFHHDLAGGSQPDGPDDQRYDSRRFRPRSRQSWSTTPRWKSKTPTATWRCGSRWCARCSTERTADCRHLPSSPPFASAWCSCRC